MANILTLDIEDWCQSSPQALRRAASGPGSQTWPSDQVISNTRHLLRILEEHGARATSFILGTVAERFPGLVREIHGAGHEIAVHGYSHLPAYMHSRDDFRRDVLFSKQLLEAIIGDKVVGYRAPYFSVTRRSKWALEILAELGLEYDASVLPVSPRYYRVAGWDGAESFERFPHRLELAAGHLLELPGMTLSLGGQNIPVAGGMFLSLVPYRMFVRAIREANRNGHPAVLYLHPHDLDFAAMRSAEAGEKLKDKVLRRLIAAGRRRIEPKLRRLLKDYAFIPICEWLAETRNRALPSFSGAVPALK